MAILGISSEHNSSAALSIDGQIVGLVQEERFTKRKNQVAFPLRSIEYLLRQHLDGNVSRIDRVVFGGRQSDPYYAALDRYSEFGVGDHVREQKELWYPHFYESRDGDEAYWKRQLRELHHPNQDSNYDFSWLERISRKDATQYFCGVERPAAVVRHLGWQGKVEAIDHHFCHAYYALYGGGLEQGLRERILVLTADAWGDGINWSASTVAPSGRLTRIACGSDHGVARIYKWCTLILGMKPNEHEYKVMGLSAYGRPSRQVAAAEKIFFDALDFRNGKFVSDHPLKDSYFDLKQRLEGHRFDNVATGLQNWATGVTAAWARHWLRETSKDVLCFSGGLSMNIKTNGDLLALPEIKVLSVPASGGDESLSAGACFALAAEAGAVRPLAHVYLGGTPQDEGSDWSGRLDGSGLGPDAFAIVEHVDAEAAAKLLAADCILARCVGRSEFGARALGNRSILANPANHENIRLINQAIKNRDFWMPFTPSILEECVDDFLENPKAAVSPYMTIGFRSQVSKRQSIIAGLHPADFSARPQFVSRSTNPEYWMLIDAFRRRTGIPALLNTSLNLHGEPMNYSLADAARTVASSGLEFLLIPGNRLLCKKTALDKLRRILNHVDA